MSNARGTVRCRVKISADIRYDTVFLPFHYGGSESANLLTEAATDPTSGMPEFKSTVVEVRPVHEMTATPVPVIAGGHG